jgi:hypothetical protein
MGEEGWGDEGSSAGSDSYPTKQPYFFFSNCF